MKRWLRNSLVAVGVLVALAAGAWLYLTAREAVPETPTFALDLDEARRLARSLPGPLPTEVRSELVGLVGHGGLLRASGACGQRTNLPRRSAARDG